jgi:hypothetical protein
MGVLRRVLVLVGFVMADRTTCGRPQQAMVACEVSGGGTDRRSFDGLERAGANGRYSRRGDSPS